MFGFFKEKLPVMNAAVLLAASNAVEVMAEKNSVPLMEDERFLGSMLGAFTIAVIVIGIVCCMKKCKLADEPSNNYRPVRRGPQVEEKSPVVNGV